MGSPYIASVSSPREHPDGRLLGPEFFDRDTLEVARDVLGKLLVRQVEGEVLWGRLVEVEAYCGPEDRAAHSFRGLTPRTRVMYGPPGRAYVYLVYGMHHCLNLVTRAEGVPQAVLIRALEPGPGVGRCSGPGLVCRSLSVDRGLNGVPLAPPALYLLDDGFSPDPAQVFQTPRIGVGYAREWSELPWRFCVESPDLSRRRSASARPIKEVASSPGSSSAKPVRKPPPARAARSAATSENTLSAPSLPA
jgi:DNA-3-methyladenine glycosylase